MPRAIPGTLFALVGIALVVVGIVRAPWWHRARAQARTADQFRPISEGCDAVTATRVVPLLMIAAIAAVLSGCVPSTTNELEQPPVQSITLEEAKRLTIEVQEHLETFVPEEMAGSVHRVTESTLLSCGPDNFMWPGGARVSLTGEADRAAIIESVRLEYDALPGWRLEDLPEERGPAVVLVHDDGREFFVDFSRESNEYRVLSFSACFPFAPELGTEY